MSATETKTDKLSGWNRPPVCKTDGDGELLEVSMGPHHPSTHGVFRMDVALDGERVVRLKPVFGYLHRNHEQIGQNASYLASMPYTDRLDYFCSLTNNWAYALAVEKRVGQAVPERAESCKRHRKRKQKNRLHIENQEHDRVQVIRRPELHPGVALRHQAAFVNGILYQVRLGRREHAPPQPRQPQRSQAKPQRRKEQNRQ